MERIRQSFRRLLTEGVVEQTTAIGVVKYLGMRDFVEASVIFEFKTVGWVGGFYFFANSDVRLSPEDKSILIHVPNIFYSPEDYHGFIKFDTNTGKQDFTDSLPKDNKGSEHAIKVLEYRPYEMNPFMRSVLNSIKETESARKEYESKHKPNPTE